ncbi:ribosome biosynthesis protein nip7 [Conglomerata obtusa]
MRPLTNEEASAVTAKLAKFINTPTIPPLQYHNATVLSIQPHILKHTSSLSRKDLLTCGTKIGKFTKTGKFHLTITATALSQYALHRVWVKNTAEMNFLYGNDVLKAHVLKMSDECVVNSYCFVFNQSEQCIGFGVLSKGKEDVKMCDGKSVVVVRMADCGEYLREQDVMF